MNLWDKVAVGSVDDCWLWTGAKNGDGYGSVGNGNGGTMLAHRAMWEQEFFKIGPGLCVLHRCDNPPCVNPSHLFLGTQADNVADCVRKGRRNQVRYKKLNAERHAEIRDLYATGEFSYAELGRRYGVTYQTIRHIVQKGMDA